MTRAAKLFRTMAIKHKREAAAAYKNAVRAAEFELTTRLIERRIRKEASR